MTARASVIFILSLRGAAWIRVPLQQLEGHGRGFAAADAQRGDTAPAAARAQRVDERGDNTRAGGANRVAKRAGTAVDVQALMIELEIVHGRHGDDRKGFVDLEQVHVPDAPTG